MTGALAQVTVSVRGEKPIPWGCNEWDWRKSVAESARAVRPQSAQQQVSSDTRFAVEIVFLMTAAHIGRADLDNLAKPMLDTLFQTRNAQVKDLSLTGALFNVDDDRIFKLILEKRLVSTGAEEGVDIKVVLSF